MSGNSYSTGPNNTQHVSDAHILMENTLLLSTVVLKDKQGSSTSQYFQSTYDFLFN